MRVGEVISHTLDGRLDAVAVAGVDAGGADLGERGVGVGLDGGPLAVDEVRVVAEDDGKLGERQKRVEGGLFGAEGDLLGGDRQVDAGVGGEPAGAAGLARA